MAKRSKRTTLQDQGHPEQITLPAAADALSAEVRDLARQFIASRRRLGAELLEAARLIAEARVLTMHGEWYVFLEVTRTGKDTAERLNNIHQRGIELPDFAAAIRGGRLTESVAWRLARPSVPPEAVSDVLSEDQPLTVEFVEQHLRRRRKQQRGSPDRSWPPGREPFAQEDQIPPHGGVWSPAPMSAGTFGGFPEPPPGTIVVLSEQDWAAAQRLTELLEGCAAGEEMLSPLDWVVLEPLAKVLARLKRRQRF